MSTPWVSMLAPPLGVHVDHPPGCAWTEFAKMRDAGELAFGQVRVRVRVQVRVRVRVRVN